MDVPTTGQRSRGSAGVDRSAGDHRRFLASVVVVGALGLWIPQLTSSFTADETVTHWVIRDGLHRALTRSYAFEQQHSLYFILESGMRRVFGASELALRLPSLLAMIAATVLVWRLGRRVADDDAGLLAAAAFVMMPGIVFAAGDARPYALALLAVVASTLALVRWADCGSKRDAAAYAVLIAASLYFHYLALVALVVHPVYVWTRRDRVRPGGYAAALLAAALLLAPAVPHALAVFDRRAILEIKIPVSASDLFAVLIPSVLAGSIVLGALVARRWDPISFGSPMLRPGGTVVIAGLWLVPAAILYGVSRAGSTLFEPRYLFFTLPGIALAAGAALRILDPARARRVAVVVVGLVALLVFNTRTHSGENWRAAAAVERAAANADTPVLFRPNFIESAQIDWLSKPEKLEYLLAELSPYPMRGDVIPIPYDLTSPAKVYIDGFVDKLSASTRFILVNDRGRFAPWLEARLPGFRTRSFRDGGVVTVVVFERSAA